MTWVFGYGSLMWRPGFEFEEQCPALLSGFHRAFSRLSTRHRGTPEKPGMVVALEPGGNCRGMAYRVAPSLFAGTLAYLDDREGEGYHRHEASVELNCAHGTTSVQAVTYLPVLEHHTHAPNLPEEKKVALIATGQGISGSSYDYLESLAAELKRLEIQEHNTEDMLVLVRNFRKTL